MPQLPTFSQVLERRSVKKECSTAIVYILGPALGQCQTGAARTPVFLKPGQAFFLNQVILSGWG
jgi:hypothetical protein